MKRDLIRFIGLLIIIIVFSLMVYPTPYYFISTGPDGGYKNIHRINRLTGAVDIFSPTSGWKRVEQK